MRQRIADQIGKQLLQTDAVALHGAVNGDLAAHDT
jgi:hypothetical protein